LLAIPNHGEPISWNGGFFDKFLHIISGGIGGGVIDEHHMKIIVFLHDYGLDIVDVPIILGVVIAWHHDTEGQLFVFTNVVLLFVVF
jgi:hypothetical protein